jgi:hypothetical protein
MLAFLRPARPGVLQRQGLGILGGVRMFGTGVDLELFQRPPPEGALRQHAPYRPANGLFRPGGQELGIGPAGQASRVPAVAVVELLVGLVGGHDDLGGIDHDDVIAHVEMGGENGLVLPPQDPCHRRAHTPEHQAVGIDDVPRAVDVGGLW